MYKYLVLAVFITIFFFLIKKDRVYVVPLILVIFSNINGLLDGEDFAFHGVIKFQDYGLLLTLILLFLWGVSKKTKTPGYERDMKNNMLYRIILFYWGYYLLEFVYSIIIQGNIEWPIKMGRTFFYGLVFFVIYSKLKPNPIVLFGKIINTLMVCTMVFGLMYVGYNLLGFDFYPKEANEEIIVEGMDVVKRNFAGFPTYAFYFLILFVHRLMSDNNSRMLSRMLNFFGVMLMAACVFLTLARGHVMVMGVVIAVTIIFRRPSVAGIRNVLGLVVAGALTIPFLLQFTQGYLDVLMLRFSEFSAVGGATQSHTFLVRAVDFSRIMENVLDFNPLFGFGFTNINGLGLGYQSSFIYGGSADNGFSNLIGVTGFVGLGIFLVMMVSWLIVNIKLQLLDKERFSKVNFIFIIYMMGSMLNGSSMSYMHNYALFMAYDLLAYAYLTRLVRPASMLPILVRTSHSRFR